MLPREFLTQLQQLLPDEWQALADAITSTEPSVSVRVNVRRGVDVPSGAQKVPWCPAGFYCPQRPAFTFDPDLHSGRYYVQDASSMFIHHVLRTLAGDSPVRYLDLCAAPGGKTTAAIDALPDQSLVVANEIVSARARILYGNVVRWGYPGAMVTNAAPKAFAKLTNAFDIIAADVPCSGEGMMRKDDEAVQQWTPTLVNECAERQRAIIDDVWPALRPGGLLIYSTCTYNREENELMVEHIMRRYGATPINVPVDPAWGIMPAIASEVPAYRFMPHRTRGEGLFMAVLRKPEQETRSKKQSAPTASRKQPQYPQAVQWLERPDDFVITMHDDTLVAVPRPWQELVQRLRDTLPVLLGGVTLATAKGKKLVPDHCLAQSTALRREAFATCEVDYATALRYLRGEAITIDAPAGYTLITHRKAPLGWVNNLGNRANNLYPKPLRILSTHHPTTPPHIL